MTCKFVTYNLGDITKFSQGIQVVTDKQELESQKGYSRFVRIIDFTNPSEPPRYIKTPSDKYYADKKDIIMIRYGSQTAGKVVRGISGYIANNMFKINVTSKHVNKEYLYYCLSSSDIYTFLRAGQSSSTMPAITFGMLKNIPIKIPPLEVQNKIVSLMNTLNLKLTINTQANQTLEEMAQAIFKSWFVDFDPVKAKMNGEQPEGMDAA
ncbi:TPA: restriction endonuclease subunit S, partial [Photobacterium damselae]